MQLFAPCPGARIGYLRSIKLWLTSPLWISERISSKKSKNGVLSFFHILDEKILTCSDAIMSDLLTFKSLSAAGHTEVNTTWSALHILLCFLQLCWQCWHDLQLCHWSCGPQRSTWLGWSQLSSARLPKQIVIVQVLRVGRIAHTFGQGLPRARLRPVGYSKPRFKSSLEVIYGETLQLTLLIELGHVQSV